MTAETDVDRFRDAAVHRPDDSSFSDAALLTLVRSPAAGDAARQAAFDQLYRRHTTAARRLASSLLAETDLDGDRLDEAVTALVADTFARVEHLLRSGQGPDAGFRPFLLSTMRDDGFDVRTESESTLHRALGQLAERWRTVLWHVEVDGERPEAVAPLVGLSPAGVCSLARRARSRLREAYVVEHLSSVEAEDTGTRVEDCRWALDHLTRPHHRPSARDRAAAYAHIEECEYCRRLRPELVDPEFTDAGVPLGGVLAPLLLGSAAEGYLAVGTAGGTEREGRNGRRVRAGATLARWRTSAASTANGVLEASMRGAAVAAGGITTIAVASLVVTTDMPDVVAGITSESRTGSAEASRAQDGADSDDEDSGARPGDSPDEEGVSSAERPVRPGIGTSGPDSGGESPDGGDPSAPADPDVSIATQGELQQGLPAVLQVSVTAPEGEEPATLTVVLSVDGGMEPQGPGDWSCTGAGTVTCVTGAVPPGSTETGTVRVRLDEDASGPITATVSEGGGGDSTDATEETVQPKEPGAGEGTPGQGGREQATSPDPSTEASGG
jgi:DNA-directed RNA polymerase specialized sigma24 family protein